MDIKCKCGKEANKDELVKRDAVQYCYAPNSRTEFVYTLNREVMCINCFNKEYDEVFPDNG